MERTIGEIFTFNGLEYKVVEDDVTAGRKGSCGRCAFMGRDCLNYVRKQNFGGCMSVRRKDGKGVHFERV